MKAKYIGTTIKKVRTEKGYTQEEIARKADIPLSTMSKIESGVIQNPGIEKVARIAEALEVTIDQLLNYRKQ